MSARLVVAVAVAAVVGAASAAPAQSSTVDRQRGFMPDGSRLEGRGISRP